MKKIRLNHQSNVVLIFIIIFNIHVYSQDTSYYNYNNNRTGCYLRDYLYDPKVGCMHGKEIIGINEKFIELSSSKIYIKNFSNYVNLKKYKINNYLNPLNVAKFENQIYVKYYKKSLIVKFNASFNINFIGYFNNDGQMEFYFYIVFINCKRYFKLSCNEKGIFYESPFEYDYGPTLKYPLHKI